MNNYHIGDTDEWGYILIDRMGPVELWETPKKYYVIYLIVTSEHILHGFRKYRSDAIELFHSVCEMFMREVWKMPDKLGWSDKELFESYAQLTDVSGRFREISERIDQKNWVAFNWMRDEGMDLGKIASEIKIPMAIAESAENARRCIIKWDSDWKKVSDCIAGKIDP